MRRWLKGFGTAPHAAPAIARHPSRIAIRLAQPDDIVAVRRMLVATWHDTYDAWIGAEAVTDISTRWHSHDRLRQETTLPHAAFLLAEPSTGAGPLSPFGRRPGSREILGTAFAYRADARGTPTRCEPSPTEPPAADRPQGAGGVDLAIAPDNGGRAAGSGRRTVRDVPQHPVANVAPGPVITSCGPASNAASCEPIVGVPQEPRQEPPAAQEDRGVVATSAASKSACEPPNVEIGRLYVATSAQGRGVGRALIEAIFAAFPQAPEYRLDVDPRNARAIRFYERHGFVVTSQGADCGGSGLAHLVMTRRGGGHGYGEG